jgi:ABC-type multidrug transport system ATPase subunit
MIELVGLHKSYSGRVLLSDAGLTVRGGECHALVGANGCGKTTTLRCAVGLAYADRGEIRINGIDVVSRPREARAHVSYLAQRTDFPPTLTVREILRVVADLRHAPRQSVEREISLCGLGAVADRTVAALSGGERQRVAMAALLIPDAAAYLLDEPTLNLDPIGTRLLVDRLQALRDDGRAVLLTTHVNGEVDGLATHVAVLRDGRFVPVVANASAGRHVSVAVEGPIDYWIGAALRGGATRAWSSHGRLHAIVSDAELSRVFARLHAEGAQISAFRTETPLATALERLNDEELHIAAAAADSVGRGTAACVVWQRARWARADSVGSR